MTRDATSCQWSHSSSSPSAFCQRRMSAGSSLLSPRRVENSSQRGLSSGTIRFTPRHVRRLLRIFVHYDKIFILFIKHVLDHSSQRVVPFRFHVGRDLIGVPKKVAVVFFSLRNNPPGKIPDPVLRSSNQVLK